MQKTFKTITEMTRKPPKQLLPDASDRPNIHEIVPTWDWPSEYPWNRSHRWPSEYAWNRSHRGSPLRTIAEIVRVGYAVRNTFCTGYAKYAKTTCAQRNGTTLSWTTFNRCIRQCLVASNTIWNLNRIDQIMNNNACTQSIKWLCMSNFFTPGQNDHQTL